jgi:hypothetical protein
MSEAQPGYSGCQYAENDILLKFGPLDAAVYFNLDMVSQTPALDDFCYVFNLRGNRGLSLWVASIRELHGTSTQAWVPRAGLSRKFG